jgi:hypothetical protein
LNLSFTTGWNSPILTVLGVKREENLMARSDIQTERMLNYFIDATAKLIKEEGIKNISIRKIAKEAGYTRSTI